MADDNENGGFLDPTVSLNDGTSDSFTETTHESFLGRLWGSIVGVLIGFALIIGCVAAIFFNEKSAIDTYRSLAEGQGLVITTPSMQIDPAKEGKLVHTTGTLSGQPLGDTDFAVTTTAVSLTRHVETYLWKQEEHSETRKNLGGGTDTVKTYTYVRVWSDKPIDSSRFRNPNGHVNPPVRFSGRTIYATDAKLGDYKIGEPLLRQLGDGNRLSLNDDLLAKLKSKYSDKVSLIDGAIYLGANPADPQIGDTRVSYTSVPPENASVVGVQSGNAFTPFQAHAGDQILMMRAGTLAADQMFKAAAEDNRILHWIIRIIIFVVMYIGWVLLFRPFVVFADILPIFGDVLGFGTGLAALLITLITMPLVTAIAWFTFRPAISLAIIAGGAALFYVFRRVLPRKARPVPQAAPA